MGWDGKSTSPRGSLVHTKLHQLSSSSFSTFLSLACTYLQPHCDGKRTHWRDTEVQGFAAGESYQRRPFDSLNLCTIQVDVGCVSSLQHCPFPMGGWMPFALFRTLSDKRWALKEKIRRTQRSRTGSLVCPLRRAVCAPCYHRPHGQQDPSQSQPRTQSFSGPPLRFQK